MSNQTATTLISHFKAQAGTPAALRLLNDLAHESLVLERASTLEDVSTALYRDQTNDKLWEPVIRAAQAGHELATLTLLSALLPRLCHIARSCAGSHTADDTDEATALAVSGILEELQRYRIGNRTNHGHSLRLAGLKRLTRDGTRHVDGVRVREFAKGLPHLDQHEPEDRAAFNSPVFHTDGDFHAVDELDAIARLLKWAIDEAVLTADEATLLARLYAGAERPISDLADDETGRARLRKRHSRAITKLRAALAGPLPQPIEQWLNAA